MSLDKLVDSTQLDSDLTSVANAIRAKSGGSGQLAFPSGFVSEIGNIPSGGGQTVYVSSTGLLYTPVMTIDVSLNSSSGNALGTVVGYYGNMPYLEDLTLTGIFRNTSAGVINGTAGLLGISRYPRLKKLKIVPTDIRNSSGNAYDPTSAAYNAIKLNHDWFNTTNLQELTIGKVGGPYWIGGGYYRSKDENNNSITTIGSTDGLTLKVYVAEYKAKGGFSSGNVAANTTIIEYYYTTGEVLTA